jgi:membrane protease YdiL (CAAX protease family)
LAGRPGYQGTEGGFGAFAFSCLVDWRFVWMCSDLNRSFLFTSEAGSPSFTDCYATSAADPPEYAFFLALCLLIGLVEEFLFRGFAFFTLAGFLHSKVVGVTIVTVFFALQHGIQDAIGIGRAFILGAFLALPVFVTGSLLPSIIAHALIDAFTGIFGHSLLKWFGTNPRRESCATG